MIVFRYLVLFFSLLTVNVHGETNNELLKSVVIDHVRQQYLNASQSPSVKVFPVNLTKHPECLEMEAFTPNGATLLGKSYVGVKCLNPVAWQVLVSVDVSVQGSYLITARPLQKGEVLMVNDLLAQVGNVSKLPVGYVSDVTNAIGKTLKISLAPGILLRKEMLLSPVLIKQGDVVKVLSEGNGFVASAEGRALGSAEVEGVVMVRMSNGQILRAKAKTSGVVEIAN